MSLELLESALLLILLVNILRVSFLTNQLVLVALGVSVIIFIGLSFGVILKKAIFQKMRFWLLILIIVLLYESLLFSSIGQRFGSGGVQIHDGAVLTEAATKAIISNKNPYIINYEKDFESVINKPSLVAYKHYMYSPLTFLINVPFTSIYKFWDFRITLVIFLLASAVGGAFLVKEKILFLIMFLLNPVFVPLTFYGANESIILFFLIACLVFLAKGKITAATVMLSFATSTKLLALPFVPLYFFYLYMKSTKRYVLRITIKQIAIFGLVNLVIYLPFVIWNWRELVEGVLFYHLKGGQEEHFIAGFLGIPQILKNLGIVSANSTFPFYLFQILVASFSLIIAYKILKRTTNLTMLSVLYVFYFCAIFLFSRIIQTSYIAFLSQILLFAAFLSNKVQEKVYG